MQALKKFDLSVFEPTGSDLKSLYPELEEWPELKELRAPEIHMCWLIGSKTSSLRTGKDKMERVRKAADISFPKDRRRPSEVIDLLNGIMPAKYAPAIRKFASVSITHRFRAYLLAIEMFDSMEESIRMTSELLTSYDATDIELTIESVSKAAIALEKMRAQIPDIIRVIETGYGLEIKVELREEEDEEEFSFEDIGMDDIPED